MIKTSIFWKVIIIFLMYIFISSAIILSMYQITGSPESISREIRSSLVNDTVLLAAKASEIIKTSDSTDISMLDRNEGLKTLLAVCGRNIRITNLEGRIIMDNQPDNKYVQKVINIDKISAVISEGVLIERGYARLFRSAIDISVPLIVNKQPIAIFQVSYPKYNPDRLSGNLEFAIAVELFTVSILAFFLSRLLTNPIKKLNEATKKMSEGVLGYQVNIHSKDEIGELGKNFNEMSLRLSNMTKARMELTADISHELRSPLSRIKTASELLMVEKTNDGERSNYLKLINDEIDELNLLIGDLLEMSKLELGKSKLDLWNINIDEIVRDVVSKVAPIAAKKGIRIILNCGDNIPPVLADGKRVSRVINNIIDNSMKFANSNGTINIDISKKADSVVTSISDNGVGVPENEISSIFERFYRTDKSRARETGGSGLGLAIVRQIVENHGGKISAQKSKSGGLEITFSLPLNIYLSEYD